MMQKSRLQMPTPASSLNDSSSTSSTQQQSTNNGWTSFFSGGGESSSSTTNHHSASSTHHHHDELRPFGGTSFQQNFSLMGGESSSSSNSILHRTGIKNLNNSVSTPTAQAVPLSGFPSSSSAGIGRQSSLGGGGNGSGGGGSAPSSSLYPPSNATTSSNSSSMNPYSSSSAVNNDRGGGAGSNHHLHHHSTVGGYGSHHHQGASASSSYHHQQHQQHQSSGGYIVSGGGMSHGGGGHRDSNSGLHNNNHHHNNHQHHHHHHHHRHYNNSAAVENERIDEVVCVRYNELNDQKVDHLGKCIISDIRAEQFTENECYHSENQRDTIVTANAFVHQTQTVHKIQRIMVGQLWMDFVRDLGFTDGHSVGRLMAFIANEPVTIFGMIPNDALKNGQTRTVPTMVGFWLSIDRKDHPESLLDLQRASILFSKKGLLAAFTPEEHRRLLEIADYRRSAGNTGLPESPMTLEAAKNPPKRQSSDGKEVDVFRYHPPANHRWPQTRGGFHPFVTRWEMSMKEDAGRFSAEKSFSLVATEMKNLRPWGKRVISKLKMVKRNESDDDIPIHSLDDSS